MIDSKRLKMVVIGLMVLVVLALIGAMLYPDPLSDLAMSNNAVYEETLFDVATMLTVEITVDPDDWQEMLDNATEEEYIRCDITVNGETYASVGIRPKGNSSLTTVASSDSDRYSFRVEFDEYVTGQTCDGLDVLVLNNMQSDATYMKEYITYDLMNFMGVNSSLYSYANITVNGEDWGCYLALEGIEESFAERVYGSDYGKLYNVKSMDMDNDNAEAGAAIPNREEGGEMDGNANFPYQTESGAAGERPTMNPDNAETGVSGTEDSADEESASVAPEDSTDEESASVAQEDAEDWQQKAAGGDMMGGGSTGGNLVYTDDDSDSYSAIFGNEVFSGDDADYARVITALENLSTGANLEESIDVDQVLRYFAVHTFVYNLDSYTSNMQQNYYLYEDDGQISILPWDYNLAFGGFGSSDGTTAVNFPIDTPVSGVSMEECPLLNQLLQVEEYKEIYYEYLEQIVDEYFNSGLFETRVNMISALIDTAVANDATAFYTYEEYKAASAELVEFCGLRAQSIAGQLAGEIPSTTTEQESDASTLIDGSSIDFTLMGQQSGGNANGMDRDGEITKEMPVTEEETTDDAGADETADSDQEAAALAQPNGGGSPPTMEEGGEAPAMSGDEAADSQGATENAPADTADGAAPADTADGAAPDDTAESAATAEGGFQGGWGNGAATASADDEAAGLSSSAYLYLGIGALLIVISFLFIHFYPRKRMA